MDHFCSLPKQVWACKIAFELFFFIKFQIFFIFINYLQIILFLISTSWVLYFTEKCWVQPEWHLWAHTVGHKLLSSPHWVAAFPFQSTASGSIGQISLTLTHSSRGCFTLFTAPTLPTWFASDSLNGVGYSLLIHLSQDEECS